ncbi:MAG: ECF transporter S component [Chloroflexi bacterium]|nr:ECF transporter S component [Chloroflexota bacterium]
MAYRFNTVELVYIAIVGVVTGLLNTGFSVVYTALVASIGPIFANIWSPFGLVTALSMLAVRKPGTALLAGFINGLVQFLSGNPAGLWALGFGIAHGLGAEAVFAAFRYRHFGWIPVFLAAAGDGLVGTIAVFFAFSLWGQPVEAIVATFVISLISYGVVSGWLGKIIIDGIYGAGLLRGFRIGTFKTAGLA